MSGTRSVMWLVGLLALASGCGGDDGDGGRGGTGGGGVAGMTGGTGGGGTSGGAGGMAGGGAHEFDAGSEPDRNMVMAGELCERVATIQCAAEVHCCDTARAFDACKTAALAECDSQLDEIAMDPRVGFDATAASAAFTAYEMRASTCDASIAAWAVSSAGFLTSFTGTVAAGGDCAPQGGLAATENELAAALASCSGGNACLPMGVSASDPMAGTWTCEPRSAMGGPCFTDYNCATGLRCDGGLSGMGTCTAAKATGMSCGLPTECASLVCAADKCAEAGDAQAVFCQG